MKKICKCMKSFLCDNGEQITGASGSGVLGLSQKPSSFDFAALDQCNTFLAGRIKAAFVQPISVGHSKLGAQVPGGGFIDKVDADTVSRLPIWGVHYFRRIPHWGGNRPRQPLEPNSRYNLSTLYVIKDLPKGAGVASGLSCSGSGHRLTLVVSVSKNPYVTGFGTSAPTSSGNNK